MAQVGAGALGVVYGGDAGAGAMSVGYGGGIPRTAAPGSSLGVARGGYPTPSPPSSTTFAVHVASAAVAPPSQVETDVEERFMRDIFRRMDVNSDDAVSKLEFIGALSKDEDVARFVLPECDNRKVFDDEGIYDAADEVFDSIAAGKSRIKYSDFSTYFRKILETQHEQEEDDTQIQQVFRMIDVDGNGSISKLELLNAVQKNQIVDDFVLPGVDSSRALHEEGSFDLISALFQAIAHGKRRIEYLDFANYFRRKRMAEQIVPHPVQDRRSMRLFIIGPGFGQMINPRQAQLVERAGYQVYFCHSVPNPEQQGVHVSHYLGIIQRELQQYRPHVVACASKGGIYMVGLWQMNFWRGPSVLLNAHPSCQSLPENTPVVLVHGSHDEVYPTPRATLEKVISSGSLNKTFLYYTADSGQLQSGHFSRVGDSHNMESILNFDTLPRLIDAAAAPEGPEAYFIRTWRDRLGQARLDAEAKLGYSPDDLRELWVSPGQRGLDDQKLFQVRPGSDEWNLITAAFKAPPRETPAYLLAPQATWDRVQIRSIQRVENGLQNEGCVKPYYESLRSSLDDQGVEFERGVHTVWAFHGADAPAIESIVNDPVSGFQPLASGSKKTSLWGSGTYFARDAKYVADGGFCGAAAYDGSRQMLMCLLITGIPCLGDPQQKGMLPFRQKPHRYNSSVDALASPEIYVVQHPGAAYPAYLITFV